MNNILFSSRYKTLVLVIMAVVIMAVVSWYQHRTFEEHYENYMALQQDHHKILYLKKQYDGSVSKNDIDMLKNHPKVIRQEKRGKGYLLEFSHLTAKEFDSVANTILNAPLMIKKMTFRHNDQGYGTIVVEFEL